MPTTEYSLPPVATLAPPPRPDGLAEFPLSTRPDGPGTMLRFSLSHRVVIVGTTGSGKTTAARMFVRRAQQLWPHVAIYALDSKCAGDFDRWPGRVPGDDVPPIIRGADGGVQVWQPKHNRILDAYSAWMERILEGHDRERPALVLIDELSSVAPSRERYADGLELLLKQGRGKAVSVIALTQNAVGIPPDVLGQTTHLMRFRLQRDTDARRVDDLLWRDGRVREPEAAYGFHYRRLDVPSDAPLQFTDVRELLG